MKEIGFHELERIYGTNYLLNSINKLIELREFKKKKKMELGRLHQHRGPLLLKKFIRSANYSTIMKLTISRTQLPMKPWVQPLFRAKLYGRSNDSRIRIFQITNNF